MFGMGTGLTGYEGYLLGRRSVESAQSTARLVESLRARRQPPPIDVNALVANNQALAAQNQALWDHNAELQRINAELVRDYNVLLENYQRLRKWADGAEADLISFGILKLPE